MTHISRSRASLRIGGDLLDPSEISKILGCDGTVMYSKGDVRKIPRTGREIIRKHGLWLLEAEECEPEDIDGQVRSILNRLSKDLSVWDRLSANYKVDLFCGIFMKESNEGMEISPAILTELGKRGILLGLDIYDGSN